MKRSNNWIVKNKRPEDTSASKDFYDSTESDRYEFSSSMKRRQEKMTLRLLDLMGVDLTDGFKILDAGCGTGFSMTLLRNLNSKLYLRGFDSSKEMLQKSKDKKLQVKLGSLEKIPFKDKFDSIICISALQWVPKENISEIASEFYRVLKKNGVAGIQYYPESEERLFEDASKFKKQGFRVIVTQDNYYNPVKRKIYVTLYKEV
ncbi:Trans-aconitate 2-methyltransferase [uncultured archaeon]|nr:Trans-aconitate 2-methyltransferase [uncultured archaeon]